MFDTMVKSDVPDVLMSAQGGHKNTKSKENYVSKTGVVKKAINKILGDSLKGGEPGRFQDVLEEQQKREREKIKSIRARQCEEAVEDKENLQPAGKMPSLQQFQPAIKAAGHGHQVSSSLQPNLGPQASYKDPSQPKAIPYKPAIQHHDQQAHASQACIASLAMNFHSQPNYSQPAYSQPAYSQPAYSQPAYSHPAYSHPAYSQPAYSQPAYSHPAYSHPDYSHPAYSHPAYSLPSNIYPVTPSVVMSPLYHSQSFPPFSQCRCNSSHNLSSCSPV